MPSSATRGKDFKLYIDTDNPYDGTPTWAEVTNIKDLTRNLETALADASIRATDFRQQRATIKDLSIDFQMVHDPYDTLLEEIESAFFNNRNVAFVALDGPIDTDGSRGIFFMGQISKFTGNEGLEDIGTHDVTVVVGYDSTNTPHRVIVSGGALTVDNS